MSESWSATVLTLFPEMFPGPLGLSLAGRALEAGTWALDAVDIRSFATDRHRSVDDTPAGGGPGMVMRADVVAAAVDAAGNAVAFSNAKALGQLMYTRYLYPVEIASVILLVAMISAIALTLRNRKESKAINPAMQVRVRAADRLQVVKMAVTQKAPESAPVVPAAEEKKA